MLAMCLLAGCGDKSFTSEDLKSEVQRAQQIARECSELLDLRSADKVTESFRKTHELYLLKQIEDLEKTASRAEPASGIAAAFNEYKSKLNELSDSVKKIESEPHKEAFDRLDHDLKALGERL